MRVGYGYFRFAFFLAGRFLAPAAFFFVAFFFAFFFAATGVTSER